MLKLLNPYLSNVIPFFIIWFSPFPILGLQGILLSFLIHFELHFLQANGEEHDQRPQSTLGNKVEIQKLEATGSADRDFLGLFTQVIAK